MFFWFNRRKRKKLEEFLQRSPMSHEEFFEEINFSVEVFVIKCYRVKLGEIFLLPSKNIYPNDSFDEISQFAVSDWDILEIILFLEEILEIALDEDNTPGWTPRKTVGPWIKDLLLRCSLQ